VFPVFSIGWIFQLDGYLRSILPQSSSEEMDNRPPRFESGVVRHSNRGVAPSAPLLQTMPSQSFSIMPSGGGLLRFARQSN
jgi:hypothetical protein